MLLERRGTDGARAKNGHPRIGIMGLAVVGSAVRRYFEAQGHRPRLYDPYLALGSRQEINKAQVDHYASSDMSARHAARALRLAVGPWPGGVVLRAIRDRNPAMAAASIAPLVRRLDRASG